MKTHFLLLCLAVSLNLYGQKVADIDLTQQRDSPAGLDQKNSLPDLPLGCEMPEYVNSDGDIVSPKGSLELKLELSILNGTSFVPGDRVKSEVLLKNVGTEPVDLPWTVNPKIALPSPNSLQHEYEKGWFELELNGQHATGIRLFSESLSNSLYSSPSAPRTSLHLDPGQWIAARVDFILEEDHKSSVGRRLTSGKATVVARWRQARYTWKQEGCKIDMGYYSYRFKIDSKPTDVEVWEQPFQLLP